jgi:hypothetical protein
MENILKKINTKTIVTVSVGILAIIILNEVRKYFRDKKDEKEEREKNTGTGHDTTKIPTKDRTTQTDDKTITDEQAEQISRVSFNAMNQMGSGNVNDIINSLKNLTGADLQKVYTQFGTIGYLAWGFSPYGVKKDIFGWYRAEYSGSALSKLKKVWEKSGLSFK